MTCKNCGAQLAENAAFCPVCGTKQEVQIPVAPPTIGVPVQDDNISAPSLGVQDTQPAQFSQPAQSVPTYGPPVQEAPQPLQTQGQTPPTSPVYAAPVQQMPQYTQAPVAPVQQAYVPNANSAYSEDKKSVGLNVLSWFIPLAGIILYFTNRKEKPIRSKSNLKVAIVSIIVNAFVSILVVGLIIGGTFKLISQTPGAHVTINGKEYIVNDDGERVPIEDYGTGNGELGWEWEDDEDIEYEDEEEEEEKETSTSDKETSTAPSAHSVPQISSLNEYKTICANGTVMTLPIKYSEFFAVMKDFQPSDNDNVDEILKPDQYTIIIATDPNQKYTSFSVYILNDSTESKKISECVVAGLSVDSPLSSSGRKAPDIQLLGLSVGQKMSIDELTKKFGEPNDTHSYNADSGYSTSTCIWEIESTSGDFAPNKAEIVINNNNGTIETMTIKAVY